MNRGQSDYVPFSQENRSALSCYWYPVALSKDLHDAPLGVTLLDTPVVIYRVDGKARAALDKCPHRGARLSDGTLDNDALVCPYHALNFDGDGKCVRIPFAPDTKISDKLALEMLDCREAYNLVWVCLEAEPAANFPSWPLLEDQSYVYFNLPPRDLRTSAARFTENFNDVTHFSWVHRGTFGSAEPHLFEPYDVEELETGLKHETTIRQIDRDDFGSDASDSVNAYYRYQFSLPFCSYLHIEFRPGMNQHIFAAVQPVSATSCRLFMQFARDYDLDEPIEKGIEFETAVTAEDVAIVESLTPLMAPLDPKLEIHIPGDRWSVVYRKRLAAMGLADQLAG